MANFQMSVTADSGESFLSHVHIADARISQSISEEKKGDIETEMVAVSEMRSCSTREELLEDLAHWGAANFAPDHITCPLLKELARQIITGVKQTDKDLTTLVPSDSDELVMEDSLFLTNKEHLNGRGLGGKLHGDYGPWPNKQCLPIIRDEYFTGSHPPVSADMQNDGRLKTGYFEGWDCLSGRWWTPIGGRKRLFTLQAGQEVDLFLKEGTFGDIVSTLRKFGRISKPGHMVLFYNRVVQHAGVNTDPSEFTTPDTDKFVRVYKEFREQDKEAEECKVWENPLKVSAIAHFEPLHWQNFIRKLAAFVEEPSPRIKKSDQLDLYCGSRSTSSSKGVTGPQTRLREGADFCL